MSNDTAVVAGVGPNLGESVVRRFAEEGYAVACLARSEDYLNELANGVRSSGGEALAVPCDITDRDGVAGAFDRIRNEYEGVDVLVNNASAASWNGLLKATSEGFEQAWRVSAYGSFLCAKQAVDDMLAEGDGTVIFTGATSSVRGRDGAVGFSAAKFAVRGLAESMARELGSHGIHVAHAVIDGKISDDEDDETLHPDEIADAYLDLVEQDRSAWTLELDLRPYAEEF
jgi:NAD(P)-dependent dehydrogenase (short-subunit alcohol dehydrogenase family)